MAGTHWGLYEDAGAVDLQVLDVARAVAAGDALARLHAAFWDESSRCGDDDVSKRLKNRLAPITVAFPQAGGPLGAALSRLRAAPRTLCHGDLLPMNMLWDGTRVSIIDFGHAELGPYFRDPARFLVFGGEGDAIYPQSAECQAAFVRIYLVGLQQRTGTRLDESCLDHDIELGKVLELASSLAARMRQGEQREELLPMLDQIMTADV